MLLLFFYIYLLAVQFRLMSFSGFLDAALLSFHEFTVTLNESACCSTIIFYLIFFFFLFIS